MDDCPGQPGDKNRVGRSFYIGSRRSRPGKSTQAPPCAGRLTISRSWTHGVADLLGVDVSIKTSSPAFYAPWAGSGQSGYRAAPAVACCRHCVMRFIERVGLGSFGAIGRSGHWRRRTRQDHPAARHDHAAQDPSPPLHGRSLGWRKRQEGSAAGAGRVMPVRPMNRRRRRLSAAASFAESAMHASKQYGGGMAYQRLSFNATRQCGGAAAGRRTDIAEDSGQCRLPVFEDCHERR